MGADGVCRNAWQGGDMVAIQSMAQAMAQANSLMLLKGRQPAASAAESFISSGAFSVRSGGVLDGLLSLFADDADLAAQFKTAAREAGKLPGIHPDNARHIAMYETIVANRGKFPPGEFYIHTELPDGASITTFIPAAGAPADSGPAWNDPGSAGMDMQARAHIAAAMLATGTPLAGRG